MPPSIGPSRNQWALAPSKEGLGLTTAAGVFAWWAKDEADIFAVATYVMRLGELWSEVSFALAAAREMLKLAGLLREGLAAGVGRDFAANMSRRRRHVGVMT